MLKNLKALILLLNNSSIGNGMAMVQVFRILKNLFNFGYISYETADLIPTVFYARESDLRNFTSGKFSVLISC